MTYDDTDELNDENLSDDNDLDVEFDTIEQKDAQVRKRIDELLERKRLKELLDDTDDW
ncbi:hypothetical protein [Thalassotalea sp. G2M2-11]|uniref:PA3496 family putative envelope integrity protein n=1 Tax=Thalassotalea sp. G2M2-11 TaxID=2787627 RepID=UPI0019CFD22F|nr:hypothetical protein [Thalassotalea sp. G2M2-11]